MGVKVATAFAGRRLVFLDTAPAIYALTSGTPFTATVQATLAYLSQNSAILVVSPVTLAECLAGESDPARQAIVVEYLTGSREIVMANITPSIGIRAALIRRLNSLKLPDCLQLATAAEYGCDAFFTNDRKLASTSHGLNVVLASDLEV